MAALGAPNTNKWNTGNVGGFPLSEASCLIVHSLGRWLVSLPGRGQGASVQTNARCVTLGAGGTTRVFVGGEGCALGMCGGNQS